MLPHRQNKHVGAEESCKNHLPHIFIVFPNLLLTLKFFLKVSLFIFSEDLILGWGWGWREEKELEQVGVAVCMGHLN